MREDLSTACFPRRYRDLEAGVGQAGTPHTDIVPAPKGTIFRVYLPAVEGPGRSINHAAVEEEFFRGNGETVLKASCYRGITAGDGTEALSIYARKGNGIDLVLTDVMMPHLDGTPLTRTLKQMNPAVKIIASKANSQEARVVELRLLHPEAILMKPCTKEQLLKTLRRAMRK